jgi:predicted nucleic acid-binding protein
VAETKSAVVYDINVLVSAFVGPDAEWPYIAQVPPTTSSPDADALSIAFDADEFSLYSSPHIMENLARVLVDGYGVQPARAESIVIAVLEIVETSGGAVIDPPRTAFDVADHEDNLILDLAIAAEATIVVSNDTDLTSLSPWHNHIAIMRPKEFVARVVQLRRGR